MNKIYETFYAQKVFTLEEAQEHTHNYQVAKNTLQRLIKANKVKRIKPGLYHIIPLDNLGFIPSPLLIAVKLKKKFFLSHLSALQVHDLIESKDIYLSCDTNDQYTLYGTTYHLIKTKGFFATEERVVGSKKCLVSSLERTFVDCLDRLNAFSRPEALIDIMSNATKLDSTKVLDILKKYRKKKLYHYAGYALERLQDYLRVDPKVLDKIRKRLSTKVYYFQPPPKGRYQKLREKFTKTTPKYVKKWRLVVHV